MHRAKLWAGAAMCAAQFLSGLCPSRVLAVNRSRPVRLITSRIFPVCPRKRTYLPILELLPPPALRERRHRGLACRLVAVSRPAVLVLAKGQRSSCWPKSHGVPSGDSALHDAAREADARGGDAETWRWLPTYPLWRMC